MACGKDEDDKSLQESQSSVIAVLQALASLKGGPWEMARLRVSGNTGYFWGPDSERQAIHGHVEVRPDGSLVYERNVGDKTGYNHERGVLEDWEPHGWEDR